MVYSVYCTTELQSSVLAKTRDKKHALETCLARTLWQMSKNNDILVVYTVLDHQGAIIDPMSDTSTWCINNIYKMLISYGATPKEAYELTDNHLCCYAM